MRCLLPSCAAVVSSLLASPLLADAPRVFDVPRLDAIEIDGRADDWGDRGFAVAAPMTFDGKVRPPENFDAHFRVGWTDRGLLVLARVADDTLTHASAGGDLWQHDAVRLIYAPQHGRDISSIEVTIAPGEDPAAASAPIKITDRRLGDDKTGEVTITAASSRTDGGYVIEALLPFDVLGIEPAVGRELAFQAFALDIDEPGDERFRVAMFPNDAGGREYGLVHLLRLADAPSPAIELAASGGFDRLRRVKVDVVGEANLAGTPVTLVRDGQVIGEAEFAMRDGRAVATLRGPMPAEIDQEQTLGVQRNSAEATAVKLAGVLRERAWALSEAPISARPSVFYTPDFPQIDFINPEHAEILLGGEYRIEPTFYDRDYNVVTRAETPGRYGAVIRIHTPDGRTLVRYRTLYRVAGNIRPWEYKLAGDIELPKHFGIEPAVEDLWQEKINEQYKWSFHTLADQADSNAALLAGLHEMPADETVSEYTSPRERDRQWWLGLKRKLNGNDQRYTKPFDAPRAIDGDAAPVVREGSLSEAGMAEDAVERIDAVLTQWAGDTDEAFIACIVRNGVIVHHKAYGTRDDKPMTTETKSYMASLSKLISGTQIMMLADQGLIDLDAPIDTYLPELKDARFTQMPTMRHLYTHTAGMRSHRGGGEHDLEHIAAELAPQLEIGKRSSYNGMSLELGVKILEQITGLTYPQFARRHLLEPLGCTNTDALNASYETQSTALDMARIGQMLLNRGAYGDKRFFSDETFEAMLPRSLAPLLGRETKEERGIGLVWHRHPGLSQRTITHGAASNAVLLIDLENQLIISMTRNRAGRNYDKYHPQFLDTIIACMLSAQPQAAGD